MTSAAVIKENMFVSVVKLLAIAQLMKNASRIEHLQMFHQI